MKPFGLQFGLLTLFAVAIWLSVFLSLIAGQGINVVLPAFIGNVLTTLIPLTLVTWQANIRRAAHSIAPGLAGWIIAQLHWTNLIYLGLLAIMLVILAALSQFCSDYGNTASACANFVSLPIGVVSAYRLYRFLLAR